MRELLLLRAVQYTTMAIPSVLGANVHLLARVGRKNQLARSSNSNTRECAHGRLQALTRCDPCLTGLHAHVQAMSILVSVGARCALSFQALVLVLLVVAQAELDFTTDQNGMTHASKEATMHYIRIRGHSNALTRPLSLHGCRRDQLPAHLTSAAAATEPADVLMTAASWYSPYKTRTFLRTFREHNQAARILMFVDPIQVAQRCATKDTHSMLGIAQALASRSTDS